MARFLYECVVLDNLSEIRVLLNYSQKIFGAQWVTSLQHGSLSSNLIGENGFLGPTCQELKNLKFSISPTSTPRPIRWGMSLENPLL